MAVRRESVVLELESNFPMESARAAAALTMLNEKVKSLNKGAVETSRANQQLSKSVDQVEKSSASGGKEIDRLSGRLRLVADAVAVLGPGLIPIGAVGIPAISGLASSMGFAAVAGGTMIAAFQGVGDALKAVNAAALDPTAANLEKAREAMSRISPEARSFVRQLRDMQPALKGLRDTAAAGMFPGFVEGLQQIETVLPKVQRIIGVVAGELGDIASNSGASFAGPRWAEFLNFLATDSAPALRDLATGVGNVTHAMAELWMATDPLSDGFSSWMVKATGDLDRWAQGLDQTQGFAEFIDYVRTTGPQVEDTLGAIGNMFLQIVQAAAPLGGPVLSGLEAVADVIAAIADSDLGTPIFTALAALALYNRALQATAALSKTAFMGGANSGAGAATGVLAGRRAQLSNLRADYAASRAIGNSAQARAQAPASAFVAQAAASDRLRGSLRSMGAEAGKAGALVGALAITSTEAGQGMGVTNTATLALLGTLGGPWGAAAGASVGAFLDLKAAGDDFSDTLDSVNRSLAGGQWDVAARGMSSMKSQMKDLNSTSGVFDFLSDGAKQLSGILKGDLQDDNFWKGTVKLSDSRQAELNESRRLAEESRASVGREAIARRTITAAKLAAQGFALTAAGAREAAMSTKEFTNSLLGANAALTRQGTLDAYTTSLLDMKDALKENGTTLDGNTRAGLANRAGMRQMAASALEYAGNMKQADRRTQFLARARNDFIGMAKAAGLGAPAARRMADSFGLIDRGSQRSTKNVGQLRAEINRLKGKIVDAKEKGAKESSPRVRELRNQIAALRAKTVKVDERGASPSRTRIRQLQGAIADLRSKMVRMDERGASAARARIASMRAEINSLRDRTVYITTVRQNRGVSGNVGRGDAANAAADGDTVPKTGLPYADRHLYLLADGERIISNRYGQVDRNKDLLDAINANRMSEGGTTGLAAMRASIAAAQQPGAYYGRGSAGGSYASTVAGQGFNLRGLTISGTLMTTFGPADIEGMIVDAIDGQASLDGMVSRTATVGVAR